MLSLGTRDHRILSVLSPLLAFGAIGVWVPSPAEAHFKLDAPASWMSQDASGGPQKIGPCAAVPNTVLGDTAGTPTNAVTVVQSGQTISVSITVTVAHPGWFRIALAEGASSTQTLTTIADPQAQAGTNCTPAIMTAPVWSPTQPIIADGLPAGSIATTTQSGDKTFSVTIPESATCTTARPCSLQVIMVMTDHPANDCYYHHCADLSIGTATDAGGSTAGGTGTAGGAGTGGGAGTTGGTGTAGGTGTGGIPGSGGNAAGAGGTEVPAKPGSGCGCVLSSGGGASWAVIAAALVALAMTRRRRR
jgi:MYXO-CTERM domain-containing protein